MKRSFGFEGVPQLTIRILKGLTNTITFWLISPRKFHPVMNVPSTSKFPPPPKKKVSFTQSHQPTNQPTTPVDGVVVTTHHLVHLWGSCCCLRKNGKFGLNQQPTIVGFLRGGEVFKGRGCSWGKLRIPFGKIGEP